MTIKNLFFVMATMVIVGLVWAGVDVKINRLGSGIQAIGYGLAPSNNRTLVVSDQYTNEVQIVHGLATVTGALTVSTNAFIDTFISAPSMIIGVPSGNTNSMLGVVGTVTTSNLVVSGLSTNAVTGLNSVPFMVIGNRRFGITQQ